MSSIGPLDILRTLSLLLLAALTFPITFSITILSLLLTNLPIPSLFEHLAPTLSQRARCRADPSFVERTILVTGVGMAKGLHVARAFYACGHRVVGADFHASWLRIPGLGYTRCLEAFEQPYLPRDATKEEVGRYVREMKGIVGRFGVDIWVSCSGVDTAIEDGVVAEVLEKEMDCRCIQFGRDVTRKLHEKELFIAYCQELGLAVPETYEVKSTEGALTMLKRASAKHPNRKYILKTLGASNAMYRFSLDELPLNTWEETEKYVRARPIGTKTPWIVQQFIRSGLEYCTHAVVIKGEIKVFLACPSSDMLMHYKNIAYGDPLRRQMLDFTMRMVAKAGSDFTGHLSFDFMPDTEDGKAKLYAIECNPRAHTALILLSQPGKEQQEMVKAYLSVLGKELRQVNGHTNSSSSSSATAVNDESDPDGAHIVTPDFGTTPRYWLSHDLVSKLLWATLQLLQLRIGLKTYVMGIVDLITHVLFWKEGTFDIWDPVPFLALHYHFMPRYLLWGMWKGKRWSMANISTLKVWWL